MGQANFIIALVNRRIDQIKELQGNLSRRHYALRSIVTDQLRSELTYYTEDSFNRIGERIDADLDYFANLLESLSPSMKAPVEMLHDASDKTSKPRVKLPAIQLPKSDGLFSKWETFRDRFTTLIITEKSLAKLEKMHYLCSALSGEPLEAISHLQITEANFDVAWNLIVNQYNNERRIIMEHLRILFALPIMTPNSIKSIRSLRDTITITLQSLRNLNRPVDQWDDILVYLVISKLDTVSRSALELKLCDSSKYPTYNVIDEFMQSRIRMLDALSASQSLDSRSNSNKTDKHSKISALTTSSQKVSCDVCKQTHPLYQCAMFLSYPISQRRQLISDKKRCFNCFRFGHAVPACTSLYRCHTCNKKHHTLLHMFSDLNAEAASFPSSNIPSSSTNVLNPSVNALNASSGCHSTSVLLATAMVIVYSPKGTWVNARALLDQGSEATFITESLAQQLDLDYTESNVMITGIGCQKSIARKVSSISIGPTHAKSPKSPTIAVILPKVTTYSTSLTASPTSWNHLKNLSLADSNPFSTAPCDLIIGAELYGILLRDGIRVGRSDEAVAQNTVFGWILSGRVASGSMPTVIPFHHVTSTKLSLAIQQFWEVENISTDLPPIPADKYCEEHFLTTHSRTEEGRYVVRLPFSAGEPPFLPSSYETALSSLLRLEKRLSRDPIRYDEYRAFMNEYAQLDHMKLLSPDHCSIIKNPYYIPHHAVIRESSTTTRLRVVFNASSKTSNGRSLNDYLSIGPKLQNNLSAMLLRWRQFP